MDEYGPNTLTEATTIIWTMGLDLKKARAEVTEAKAIISYMRQDLQNVRAKLAATERTWHIISDDNVRLRKALAAALEWADARDTTMPNLHLDVLYDNWIDDARAALADGGDDGREDSGRSEK